MIKEAWARNGSGIPTLEGEEFGRFVSSEVQRWRKVVTDAGVIEEEGTPDEIFNHPKSERLKTFLSKVL